MNNINISREQKDYRNQGNGEAGSKEQNSTLLPMLGWFSLGLGLAEVLTPKGVAKAAGLPEESRHTVRAFGAREIVSGIGMFSRRVQPAASWSRVVGDVLDLSVLGKSLFKANSSKAKLGISSAAVLGVTVLDILASMKETPALNGYSGKNPLELEEALAINKSPEELFTYWRDLSNLPNFMSFLDTVVELDPQKSHWKTKEVAGKSIEWKSVIKREVKNETIEWETDEGSDISHSGSVTFRRLPRGHGTEVRLKMQFAPKAGAIAPTGLSSVLSFIGEEKVRNDLKRFRQLIETGEIATTRGQPAGRQEGETTFDKIARAQI
jgi:uncharacterized membrane protein